MIDIPAFTHQPKLVLDLATPEGYTRLTWSELTDIVLIFALIFIHMISLRYMIKVTFETCFTCMKSGNFLVFVHRELSFPSLDGIGTVGARNFKSPAARYSASPVLTSTGFNGKSNFRPLQNRHPLTDRYKMSQVIPLQLCQIWCTSVPGGLLGEWVKYN